LKAVETSTEETKDASQTKLVEAKLRAELLHARAERDEAHQNSLVAKRSLELLSNDVTALKTERTQLKNDKLRLDRERRSAQSLAESLSRSSNRDPDVDYYKRKSVELETHLQGMTSRLMEKNREINELRNHRDRNLSQNRLAALKAIGGGTGGTTRIDSGSNSKKSRYSY